MTMMMTRMMMMMEEDVCGEEVALMSAPIAGPRKGAAVQKSHSLGGPTSFATSSQNVGGETR
ncbi:hypothetical protein EYF80_034121 [Liparis tanakae]|uniref:Uncharacterized protein n=1 Tax=Liparis tanakae TaxID=230148 RepID=A0A4Z2GQE9_9TELE|nr:hypothetical protein EYF80_034121 [Liparis tanakae]